MTVPDTFITLAGAVRSSLPRIAAQMNVSLNDVAADSITDTIIFGIDESTAAGVYFGQEQEATKKLTQLIGSHLRSFYFLQVGVELALRLGYCAQRDFQRMQDFADTYNSAFECALPERTSELYTLPSVAEFVDDIFAQGFEYPHITRTDDGRTITEWRRAWRDQQDGCAPRNVFETHRPETDGPAVTRVAPNGTVEFEEYVEHDRTHRSDGPAMTLRSDGGEVREQAYYRAGVLHREDGPAFTAYNRHGDVIALEYYFDGQYHRIDGPARVAYGDDGAVYDIQFSRFGRLHRDKGPALFFSTENLYAEYFYENGELHRHDGPAERVLEYSDPARMREAYWKHGSLVTPNASSEAS